MTGFEAVLLYIVWIVVQVLTYAGPRIPAALFTGKPMDSWERTKAPTDSAFFMRAKGAHLNSMENFPLFAAVVCIGALMSKSAVVDTVAAYVLYLRVAQGVTHMIGDSAPLVLMRASFFLAQIVLLLYIVWGLMH